MVKIINADEYYSEEDLLTMKGEYFGGEWIHYIYDEDVDIYDGDKFILSFRKNIISNKSVGCGFDNFKKLINPSRGRGASAGPIDPESVYWKKRQLVNTKGFKTGYLVNGKVSKMKVNNNVYSSPIGYFDKLNGGLGKTLPCRLTAYTKDNLEIVNAGMPFIKEIANYYQQIRPNEYNIQNERAQLSKEFTLDETPFSTITINRNFRTALHKDAGDFGGIACLSVLEEGKFNGGLFMIPRYGIAINMRQGDLLIADVHQFHCNTELWTTPEQDKYNQDHANSFRNVNKGVGILGVEHDFSRLSFVCYLREKLIDCNK
jgi:hypothetical protein